MDLFNLIKIPKLKRNVFDLSHEVKLTCRMGDLVPIMCEEVVPGDTFKLKTEMLMRFMPLVAPVMHRVEVYTHFFFVPNRLVWDEWEDFITGGEDGSASPAFPVIVYPISDDLSRYPLVAPSSLYDYLGFSTPSEDNLFRSASGKLMRFSALPFRAYQLIYNEYYRDQNLTDEVEFSKGSGDVVNTNEVKDLLTIRKRAWEKDYFTSALPWTQRGEDVTLPIDVSSTLQVQGQGDITTQMLQVWYNPELRSNGNVFLWKDTGDVCDSRNDLIIGEDGKPYVDDREVIFNPLGTLGISRNDMYNYLNSNVSIKNVSVSATINEMRRAIALQRWLERNARGGSRYIEQILSHFGVRSSDSRLQRPEYLGGGKTPVQFSEVLQTSQSTDEAVGGISSPQGNMAGHGISVGQTHSFKKFFEEHGFVIGIMSIRPRTGYFQGTPRKYQKFDKLDYYFPEFAHLGEQEVRQGELFTIFGDSQPSPGFFEGDGGLNNTVFGYQSRYAEYKYIPDRVHGDFRTNLDFWHLARRFSIASSGGKEAFPRLNTDFVEVRHNDRIFAVDDDDSSDKVLVQLFHNLKAVRPMPKFGTPSL